MNYIDESQLGTVLSALGEQLRASDAVAHLVVVGGSGLLAIGAVDRATQDVDVVAVVRGGALHTHLKLYAYTDRREPRDLTDLRSLGPSPAELHAAARWARTHNAPGPFDELIAKALAELGVDDVGRQD